MKKVNVITSYSIHYTKLYELQYQQEQTKILGCRLTPAHRLLRSRTKGWHLDFKAAGLSAVEENYTIIFLQNANLVV